MGLDLSGNGSPEITPSCMTREIETWLSGRQTHTLIFASSPGHTHTHPFNGPLSGTTQVSRYQKGKTNLDFTEARDSEWQWHQLRHMQVCTSLQTDNHANTPPLGFLQAGCPSCRPTNSVKALKATHHRGRVTKSTKQRNGPKRTLAASPWSTNRKSQPAS